MTLLRPLPRRRPKAKAERPRMSAHSFPGWSVLGWALMAMAVLMWLALIAVPFLPQLEGRRVATGFILWLGGEAVFGVGALMAAPALLKSHWLRRLFGKRDE